MFIIVFLFGIILGSFFNVVALRGIQKESLNGRSMCPKCGNTLKPWHLVPIFSYLFQKGKCAYCHEKIDWIYPVFEFLTGFSWAVTYLLYGINIEFFVLIILYSVLIISTLTDLKEMIVLDGPMIIAFVLIVLIRIPIDSLELICYIASGVGFFIVLWCLVSRDVFGGGDAKLFALIGFSLGAYNTICILTIACIFASIISLPMKRKGSDMIRFVPYIYSGFLVFNCLYPYFSSIM